MPLNLLLKYLFAYSCSFLFWGKLPGLLVISANSYENATNLKWLSEGFQKATSIVDSSSAVIPFTMAGNLILIQASADTTEGSFILDTGCPNLVLNLTYFRNYPVHAVVEDEKATMAGSLASIAKTMVNRFSLAGHPYYRIEAELVNLGHIENSKGVKVVGLIGVEFFKNCEMIIDYEKSLIHLHWIGKKEVVIYQHQMLNDTAAYSSISIDLTDNRIIARTEMAGKKLKLIVDSGAENNVLDSRLPDKIFEQIDISGRITLTGIGNKKVDALKGTVKRMRIGDQEFGSSQVLITNLEKTCFSYNGCVDGILGFDFLSLQKIGFNFVKRKMYIWR